MCAELVLGRVLPEAGRAMAAAALAPQAAVASPPAPQGVAAPFLVASAASAERLILLLDCALLVMACSPDVSPLAEVIDEALECNDQVPGKCIIKRGGTAKDLAAELAKHKPRYFLFSGHADASLGALGEKTLCFTRLGGGAEAVESDVVATTLGRYSAGAGGRLELVVLNGCDSYDLGAKVANTHRVPYVVCWQTKVKDGAARVFAVEFFSELRRGGDVPRAFEMAKDAVQRETTPGQLASGQPAAVTHKGLAGDSGGNVARVFGLLFLESDGGQPMQLSTVAANQPIKKGEYRCICSYAFGGKDGKLPSRAYYYESWPHDSPHVDYALLHVHYATQPDVQDGGKPTHVNLRKCWRVDEATIDAMRDPANTAVTDYPPPAGMAHPADRNEWQEWIDKFKGGGAAAEAHYQAYLHNWSADPKVNPKKQYFHPPGGFGSLPPGDGLWMEASGDVKGGSKGGGYPLTGGYGSSSFAMQPWAFSADAVPPFAWDTPKVVVLENKNQAVELEAHYDDARPTVKSSPAALPAVLMDAPLRVSATQAALKVERERKGRRFEKALQSHSTAVAAGPQDVVVCFRCHDPGEGGHEGCFNPAADVEYRCCVRAKQVNDPNAAAKKKQPIVTEQQLAPVLRCGEAFRQGEVVAGRHNPTTGWNRSSGSSSAPRDYSAMARASARLCDFADAASEGEGGDSPTSDGEGDDL